MDQFKLNQSKLSGEDKLGSNPNEMILVCAECGNEITDLRDGLIVIERDNRLDYINGHIVHKGDCDTALANKIRNKGFNANSNMEISSLGSEDNIRYYLSTGKNPFDR